jgi:cytochrome c-type biogenesis protein CcmH/NrfG
MRTRALALVLLLATGCATREAAAPEPAPAESVPAPVAPPADPEREARIQQAAALKYQAHTLATQQRPGQAIALLQRSILLNGDDPETHAVLGSLLLQLSRFPLAALSFERARELSPDDPRIDAGLGTAYHRMGRYAEAKAPLLRASQAFPTDYPLLLQLGRVSFATNDFALCAESFRKFTDAMEERDPKLLPEMYKQDYQRALAFAELCEQKAR